MTKLFRDDPNIDAFSPQLGGMGMSEAVSMHAFSDPSLATQSGEEDTDVAILEGLAVE